jgi:hypothetical protein
MLKEMPRIPGKYNCVEYTQSGGGGPVSVYLVYKGGSKYTMVRYVLVFFSTNTLAIIFFWSVSHGQTIRALL